MENKYDLDYNKGKKCDGENPPEGCPYNLQQSIKRGNSK